MIEIELETPYLEDYDAIMAQVVCENETGYLLSLKTHRKNIQDYKTVFFGFPTEDMV